MTVDDSFQKAFQLHSEGRYADARAAYETILGANPQEPEILREYAQTLGMLGDYSGAEAALRRALAFQPSHAATWSALGAACGWLGKHAESGTCYDRALELGPGMPQAHYNRALRRLLHGDFAGGWQDYRWGVVSKERRLRTLRPEWDGAPIPGKTLFLWAEQGAGDAVMFVRFVNLARQRSECNRVVLECHDSLVSLFQHQGFADEVYELQRDGATPWQWDEHASLMSLPAILGVCSEQEVERTNDPYIRADKTERTEESSIGICWEGSRKHANDANRSTRLADWETIRSVPQLRFVSLQKSARREEPVPEDSSLLEFDLPDFARTAQIIAGLDLIITVDTAVAHLAGAMGKPVWILLPHVGDFRWMLDRDDSPWYPSARLFRRGPDDEWPAVMERVAAALEEKFGIVKSPGVASPQTGVAEQTSPSVTPGARSDCVLIQQATGGHRAMLELTGPKHAAYCERHGIDFLRFGDINLPEGPKHPFWAKVALIREMMRRGYEKIVWLDADTFICGDEDLREAIPQGAIGMTWHTLDWEKYGGVDCYDHFCTGAIYLENVAKTHAFVERWWETPDEDHRWVDQHAMNKVPTVGELAGVIIGVDPKWNSCPFFESPTPVVKAWHGFGNTFEDRVAAMRAAVKMPFEEFERVASDVPGAGTDRHVWALYGLVRWLRPGRIVEVGTWRGKTAVWLARALQDNGEGRLFCIDDFSLDAGSLDALQENIQLCDVGEAIDIISGGSSIAGNWPEYVDMAYIDGDHSYEGVRSDFLAASERGATCIVLHDTRAWWGPLELVERFAEKTEYDLIEAPFDEGLAIFMRRSDKSAPTYSQQRFPAGRIPSDLMGAIG